MCDVRDINARRVRCFYWGFWYNRKMKVRRAGAFLFLGIFILLFGATLVDSQTTVGSRRTQLESDLAQLEKEIEEQQKVLEGKQRERVSLERDVAILDAQIEKARLSIRARTLSIQKLTGEIQGKESTVVGLNERMLREKESLAELLRATNEISDSSLVLLALSRGTISDFFSDLASFDSIKRSMSDSFVAITQTKTATLEEKQDLEQKREEETELRTVQELQKRKIEEQEAQKAQLLKATKGQEAAYQELIAGKQRSAAQIRAELFELRGSAAIPFEQAYAFAKQASATTGVRPAFILGIIAEESNLGENVGTGSWQVDMHPTRDRPIFEKITSSLGLNPNVMPVSKKPWYGWGGAMGPAQFIPSTWALYVGYEKANNYAYNPAKDRVGKLTGNTPANPWNPEDAITASALYLGDSGADTSTSRNEFIAAMCYLAGCGNANKKSLQFYGDDVMCLALKYQRSIDVLEGTNIAVSRQGDIYHAQCL